MNKTTAWKYNNLINLEEKKSRILYEKSVKQVMLAGLNPSMTEDQKNEVRGLWSKENNAFKVLCKGVTGDELATWTYEDFKTRFIDNIEKVKGKNAKVKNIEGLRKDIDYIVVGQGPEFNGWTAYMPLTFKGASILADKCVPPVIHIFSKTGKPVEKATWCTAANESSFNNYTEDGYLINFFQENNSVVDKYKKIQFSVDKNTFKIFKIFNAEDNPMTQDEYAPYLSVFERIAEDLWDQLNQLYKRREEWSNTIIASLLGDNATKSMYYNGITKRFDIPKVLTDEVTLDKFIKDGQVVIPIGVWEGDLRTYGHIVSTLKSLDNLPKKVIGTVEYRDIKDTTIKGCPKDIDGSFICCNCDFESLSGGPSIVTDKYTLYNCNKLQSMVGCCTQDTISSLIITECESIQSLEGCPKKVRNDFIVQESLDLTSLKGCPSEVGGSFYCAANVLKSLEGCPNKIKGNLDCSGNILKSLKGISKEIGGYLDCSNNLIKELEEFPTYIGDDCDLSDNELTSLSGIEKTVIGGDLNCRGNKDLKVDYEPLRLYRRFYR